MVAGASSNMVSADVEDLSDFADRSQRHVVQLRSLVASLDGQRRRLSALALPGFVDRTTIDRVALAADACAETGNLAGGVASVLRHYGPEVSSVVLLPTVSAHLVDAVLADVHAVGLGELETQLASLGADETTALAIVVAVADALAEDGTRSFDDALWIGLARYHRTTVHELQRAARAFRLNADEVAATIEASFPALVAHSAERGRITADGLVAAADDPTLADETRQAAQRLVLDQALFNDLDTADQTELDAEPYTGFNWDKADGAISLDDVVAFRAKRHQAEVLSAWHPLVDTAAQGYDLSRVDSHVGSDDVVAFVADTDVPVYVRLAVFDVYAERYGLDLEHRVELEQELAFDQGLRVGGTETLRATPGLSPGVGYGVGSGSGAAPGAGLGLPSLLGSGPAGNSAASPFRTAGRSGAGGGGGGGGGHVVAALVAATVQAGAEYGINQAKQAYIQRRGTPQFVALDPATGHRSVVPAADVAHLSAAELKAWAVAHATTGRSEPSVLEGPIQPHRYLDADGTWRRSDTNQVVWDATKSDTLQPLEVVPPAEVYVDPNGTWRNRADGSLYTGVVQPRGDQRPSYDCDSPTPPRINLNDNDAWFADEGAHTNLRHGPELPFRRGDAPPGVPTVEGRIYGDDPWPFHENWSYRWLDHSRKQRAVQEYVDQNWAEICKETQRRGYHLGVYDLGQELGRGFFNSGMYRAGEPRNAVYGRTSLVRIRFRLLPGSESEIYIATAHPYGGGE